MSKKLLKELVEVQSYYKETERMTAFLLERLERLVDYELVQDGQTLYVTKGEADIYPCMVAHTDTVHEIVKNGVWAYELDDYIIAMDANYIQVGTGGDDKCGIWATLMLLESQPYMKAAFFHDEEIGCIGSRAADMSFFDDVGFVLQCDRRGHLDITDKIGNIQMVNDEFKEAVGEVVTKFQREWVTGGMTDVQALAEKGLKVCAMNMSCNYIRPHSDTEIIYYPGLKETLKFCTELFETLQGVRWEIDRKFSTYVKRNYGWEYPKQLGTTIWDPDCDHPFTGIDTNGKEYCTICFADINPDNNED